MVLGLVWLIIENCWGFVNELTIFAIFSCKFVFFLFFIFVLGPFISDVERVICNALPALFIATDGVLLASTKFQF